MGQRSILLTEKRCVEIHDRLARDDSPRDRLTSVHLEFRYASKRPRSFGMGQAIVL